MSDVSLFILFFLSLFTIVRKKKSFGKVTTAIKGSKVINHLHLAKEMSYIYQSCKLIYLYLRTFEKCRISVYSFTKSV